MTSTTPATPAQVRPADRKARRRALRAFRPRRVGPALVAAVAVTAAGVLAVVEVIAALTGKPAQVVPLDRVTTWLTGTAWEDAAVIVAAGVLLALGLACLLYGLKPGHTGLVRLQSDDPDLVLAVTRGGLRTALAEAAGHVELVAAVAPVKLRRRRVVVTVTTPVQDTDSVDRVCDGVRSAVRHRLDELAPRPLPKKIIVRTRGS